ncbi:hypothetical protein IU500_30945 [Nocardia terpenica]|uniref:hypothetical protein n=1 Tax=Nocardia terpenica TaxID=455432 RepID=UPI00189392FE|nr:hypothetical protein [Nocardia terpenica]MBF6065801.1 hypothetical protein [Nocardia terpenica]MBF6108436.1 hypothetical protein [Nocardia terpenica]MBF6115916.1 hypothetical protein [Nocardia terpenica]MBF6123046.1 hypothetical protein [Nocardia terpenica]MBF6156280.1 hypothetical protein [Nocardia terpenica]
MPEAVAYRADFGDVVVGVLGDYSVTSRTLHTVERGLAVLCAEGFDLDRALDALNALRCLS